MCAVMLRLSRFGDRLEHGHVIRLLVIVVIVMIVSIMRSCGVWRLGANRKWSTITR